MTDTKPTGGDGCACVVTDHAWSVSEMATSAVMVMVLFAVVVGTLAFAGYWWWVLGLLMVGYAVVMMWICSASGSDDDLPPLAVCAPSRTCQTPPGGCNKTGCAGKDTRMTIEIYKDVKGEYRWRARHRNGLIVADSGEGYVRKYGAKRAAKRLIVAIKTASIISP